jgi:hypothetical protein
MKNSNFDIPKFEFLFVLSDQDSNLDKRYQKPSYYLYTIGQFAFRIVILFRNRMQM